MRGAKAKRLRKKTVVVKAVPKRYLQTSAGNVFLDPYCFRAEYKKNKRAALNRPTIKDQIIMPERGVNES